MPVVYLVRKSFLFIDEGCQRLDSPNLCRWWLALGNVKVLIMLIELLQSSFPPVKLWTSFDIFRCRWSKWWLSSSFSSPSVGFPSTSCRFALRSCMLCYSLTCNIIYYLCRIRLLGTSTKRFGAGVRSTTSPSPAIGWPCLIRLTTQSSTAVSIRNLDR